MTGVYAGRPVIMSWLPGWNSVSGAHLGENIFFWFSIVALILLASRPLRKAPLELTSSHSPAMMTAQRLATNHNGCDRARQHHSSGASALTRTEGIHCSMISAAIVVPRYSGSLSRGVLNNYARHFDQGPA